MNPTDTSKRLDEELAEDAKAGDTDALAQLITRYLPLIRGKA